MMIYRKSDKQRKRGAEEGDKKADNQRREGRRKKE